MVGLAKPGATGTLNLAGQDAIYIEAVIEGRSRDIVAEVELNGETISQRALGLRVAVPTELITGEAKLLIRRHSDEPFAAGFNPIIQITGGAPQSTALILAGLDIAGRSTPVLASFEVRNGQLMVTRLIGQGSETCSTTSQQPEASTIRTTTEKELEGEISSPSSPSSPLPSRGSEQYRDIKQLVRHAKNRRTENGEPVPEGNWIALLDTSASAKAVWQPLHIMQAILEETLITTVAHTPSSTASEDWIGSPQLAGAENTVVVTDIPFTNDPGVHLIVINAARLEEVFGQQTNMLFLTPEKLLSLENTSTAQPRETQIAAASNLVNLVFDFLTQKNRGN
ncbi:MAG: hypothetical protein ACTHWM_05325 [Yaniella sp.]|uniref:hypothetical protein n=1 Tax=Yaniella sp. TaxID=2773929 RepID=UPI003F968A2D